MPEPREIQQLKAQFEHELFESVLPFWERHSPDREHGGYFNHLDYDGVVYDPTKNVWLQARQVWLFSKLYNAVEQNPNWLELAKLGMDFLRKYAAAPTGRVYFSLTADGQPIYQQRKIFSECFYAMALAEYARAAANPKLLQEACRLFDLIWDMVLHPSKVGRPILEGTPRLQSLAAPMIVLNLIAEIAGDDLGQYREQAAFCIAQIEQHFVEGKVYELIGPKGRLVPELAQGRLLNPGHAIEAGWFLLEWAARLNDPALQTRSFEIIRQSYTAGWDQEQGGLFYFLDAGGFSPTQLEWDMKLWWPHCEAMVAFLMLYSLARERSDWDTFIEVKEYAFSHFSDSEHGEWFGYLNRRGEVTQRFKGGPYKGCFHVPRALWLCWRLLADLSNSPETGLP
jgi:N-acylglucosamine 2-epimerase